MPLFFSIARCARKVIMKTYSCCVTAVTKAVTLTVTNPKYLLSQRETGTAHLAYSRYQRFFIIIFFPHFLLIASLSDRMALFNRQ